MSFKAVKGQDKAIDKLREYIGQAHLAHGYLFLGPEGVGKNLVAKTLAKTVNCMEETSDSCDRCISCLKIDKNQHPDVHFISDEVLSQAIKIEDIRQLQREINLKPYEGRRKVFIINNANNLTPEASSALLKILEEPPKDSLIILVSSKPSLLFKTIISRCQVLKFSPLPRQELEEILEKDYALEKKTVHYLAYFCEGRIGAALNLKGADILKEKNQIIDKFIFSKQSPRMSPAGEKKEDMRIILNTLAAWFRDIYLVKIGMPHSELINLDRKGELSRLTERYSFAHLDEILNSISDSLLLLEQNVNIKLLISNLGFALRN